MRPSNKSRSRNKAGSSSGRRNVGNVVNRVFESAGPDGKVRGTPQQIIEKYHALARDAQVSGDRVAAENYQQHAEHYTRLLGEALRQFNEARGPGDRDDRDDRDEAAGRDDQAERHQRREPDQRQPDQRQQPAQRQPEPAGLTTIGADEGEDAAGPVDTPEEAAARARSSESGGRDEPGAERALNGEHRGGPEEPADDRGEAPPKRSRSRRKPKAQPAEAPAAE